jgi:N-acetylmuramoyl-L-alanine amidase
MAKIFAKFKFLLIYFFIHSIICPAQVILIDPGHGGTDLGAVGKWQKKSGKKTEIITLYEKDIALKLAQSLKSQLQSKYMVYLTRTEDYVVTLHDRATMAEKVKADIFISIHFNSATEKEAVGIETFYLDNHQDKAVKKVESVENIGISSNQNEDDLVNHILIDLAIKMTSSSSKKLAQQIHQHSFQSVKQKYSVKDRGFKPGLLYVLALSKRPGVLIEAGFLSNQAELFRLTQKKYRDLYAIGVAKGIDEYFKQKK